MLVAYFSKVLIESLHLALALASAKLSSEQPNDGNSETDVALASDKNFRNDGKSLGFTVTVKYKFTALIVLSILVTQRSAAQVFVEMLLI